MTTVQKQQGRTLSLFPNILRNNPLPWYFHSWHSMTCLKDFSMPSLCFALACCERIYAFNVFFVSYIISPENSVVQDKICHSFFCDPHSPPSQPWGQFSSRAISDQDRQSHIKVILTKGTQLRSKMLGVSVNCRIWYVIISNQKMLRTWVGAMPTLKGKCILSLITMFAFGCQIQSSQRP